MDKIENVELRRALSDIAQLNTHSHLAHDLNISIEQMERALKLPDPADKTLLWVSYPCGIDCDSERQFFQKDTRSHNTMDFHAQSAKREQKLAYAVDVTGMKNGEVIGNIYAIDIKEYVDKFKQRALLSNKVRIFADGPDSKEIIMPKEAFDRSNANELPKMIYWRNEPMDSQALDSLLSAAKAEREANCKANILPCHVGDLFTKQNTFFANEILQSVNTLPKPNSPDGKFFVAKLSHNIVALLNTVSLNKILENMPYKNVEVSLKKGQEEFHVIIPRHEVLQERNKQPEKQSLMTRIQDKKVEADARNAVRSAPAAKKDERGI